VLVENAVKNYLARNFRNLSVSYGCTGGQHRSVYMTERLAGYIRANYKVRVVVSHTAIDSKP
jgi:RNase adaptor protein for sRNA GlmZ degradation